MKTENIKTSNSLSIHDKVNNFLSNVHPTVEQLEILKSFISEVLEDKELLNYLTPVAAATEDTKDTVVEVRKSIDNLYTNEEAVQKDLINPLVNEYKVTRDIKIIKEEIIKGQSKICAALANPYQDKEKIKDALALISSKVNPKAEAQVSTFNDLYDFAEEICNMPVSTDGRWYSYSDVHNNVQGMYMFTQFIGNIAPNFDLINFDS